VPEPNNTEVSALHTQTQKEVVVHPCTDVQIRRHLQIVQFLVFPKEEKTMRPQMRISAVLCVLSFLVLLIAACGGLNNTVAVSNGQTRQNTADFPTTFPTPTPQVYNLLPPGCWQSKFPSAHLKTEQGVYFGEVSSYTCRVHGTPAYTGWNLILVQGTSLLGSGGRPSDGTNGKFSNAKPPILHWWVKFQNKFYWITGTFTFDNKGNAIPHVTVR